MVTAANGEQYLVLPDQETWDDNASDHYYSDAMFIRKSYVEKSEAEFRTLQNILHPLLLTFVNHTIKQDQ